MSGQISDVFGMLKREGQRTVSIEEMSKFVGGGDDDRAADLLRIQTLAEHAFADRDEKDNWLREPLEALNGATPIEAAQTETGARRVEEILGKISRNTDPSGSTA
ncbi:antitoxin Xre/MbcA/ParS toxin-binding domain-containing protein [Allosphingosinicella humi]